MTSLLLGDLNRDTCGQDSFETLGKVFYRGTDAAILVYDVTRIKTFEDLDRWLLEINSAAQLGEDKIFPFVVFGNKCDLEGSQVLPKVAEAWSKNKGALNFYETSAKDGIQVEMGFVDIVNSILGPSPSNEENAQTDPPFKLEPIKQRKENCISLTSC